MNIKELKKKAKAAKAKLSNQNSGNFDDFDFDLMGLGDVSAEIEELVHSHGSNVDEILSRIEKNVVKFSRDNISHEENDLLYNTGITDEAKKAWVFFQRTYRKIPMTGWEPYHIEGTLEEIDELVKAGALFYNGNQYMPLPLYTWGNIYERLQELQSNKDFIVEQYGQDIFQNHVNVLEAAKPKQLRIDDEDENRRPVISAISKFAYNKRLFSISKVRTEYSDIDESEQIDKKGNKLSKKKRINLKFDGETEYSLQEVFIKWLYSLDRKRNFTGQTGPFDVHNYYLLGMPISGTDTDLTAAQKAQIKQEAREQGERLFSKFLNEVLDFEDIQRLNNLWNAKYNGWSDLNYAAVPIMLETSATFLGHGFAIRPEKREGIAYMSAVGSGIIAYDVGVGKTITALLELASALQSGKAKRALLVVPNPTYKNWIKEAFGGVDDDGKPYRGILSGTGITYNDWYNLGTSIVSKLDKNNELDREVKEKSITILTYEGFMNLGFSDQVSMTFVNEFIEIMEQNTLDPDDISVNTEPVSGLGDYETYNEMGMEGLGAKSKRDDAKSKEGIMELIGLGAKKNTVADVDTLGFDYIVVDEAHRCKNIFSGVKADANTGAKNYLLSGSQSTTGIKAFFITNYIQRVAAPQKGNVMLLTATPFTNSPLEVYSMMSLVGYDYMIDAGLYNINDFFKMFVKPEPEYVVKYDGSVVVKDTIKGYTNRLILQKLVFTKINYKSGDELVPPLQRPIKINIPLMFENVNGRSVKLPKDRQVLSYLRQNEMQADNQAEINERLRNIKRDNFTDLLRYMNASQDNAFSPYLYKLGSDKVAPATPKEFVENSPKILYAVECIKSVKQHHEKNNQPVSGQIIYSDRGVSYFPLIKEYLITEVGYKRNVTFEGKKLSEVMIIAGGDGKEKVDKEIIKEAFLAGVVKIVIGSSTIREGINLQTNGTVIYDLRPDWNPTDFRQLEGRIHRQKNKFGYVRIVLPLVENSMDVFMFQKLEEKTSRINDIFYREGSSNMLDLSSLDPGEIKYALIADIGSLAKIDFGVEYEKVSQEVSIIREDLQQVKQLEYELNKLEENRKDAKEELSENASRIESLLKAYEDTEDKERKKFLERASKLLIDIKNAITDGTTESMLNLKQRMSNYNSVLGYNYTYMLRTWKSDQLKNVYISVKKKEKTVLKPKGLSLTDKLDMISETIAKESNNKYQTFLELYGLPDENGNLQPLDRSQLDKVDRLNNAPKRYGEIYEYIANKKKELAIEGRSVKERVEEFKRLNYLLDYSMKDIDPSVQRLPAPNEAPPKRLVCPPVDSEGKRRIDDEALKQLEQCIAAQPSTKSIHTDSNGKYTAERLQLHDSIIEEFKEGKPCITHDKPICILTGGAPGSGKSTFLKKFAPWINSGNLYHVDADEVRAKLPEYEGWNSANTHEETRDLVRRLLNEIGDPCTHDMVYDGTMTTAASYKPLIEQLRRLGYIVFVIYIQVPKEVSMSRALSRYQHSGRYVPPSVIENGFKTGTKAFEEVVKDADGYIHIDGMTGKVLKRGGFQLPETRNYNMEEAETSAPAKVDDKTKKMKLLKLKAKAAKAKLLLMGMEGLKGDSADNRPVTFENLKESLELIKTGYRVERDYEDINHTDFYYMGIDEKEAREEYNYQKNEIDREYGRHVQNVSLSEFEASYDEDRAEELIEMSEEEFEDTGINVIQDLMDELDWRPSDRGSVEYIEVNSIGPINASSDALLELVQSELASLLIDEYETYYGGYKLRLFPKTSSKYNTIKVTDESGYWDVGKIQLRIADHSYNPRNNDVDKNLDGFISVVIANQNATEDRFHGEYNRVYEGDADIEDIARDVNEDIMEWIDRWDLEDVMAEIEKEKEEDEAMSGIRKRKPKAKGKVKFFVIRKASK